VDTEIDRLEGRYEGGVSWVRGGVHVEDSGGDDEGGVEHVDAGCQRQW